MLQLATGEGVALTNPTHFSRMFNEHHGLIFRTAYRITGNAADAEDVLQTIFLRLVRQHNPDSALNEESYLRRAAVNASLDLLRTRQSSGATSLHTDPVSGGSADTHEMRDCLRRAFASLSPRSAEIFALRHLEDFNNREIANMLGMSQVLVAVTLHRARRQLQKEIRSYREGKL